MKTQTRVGQTLIAAGLSWALCGTPVAAARVADAAPTASAQAEPGPALTHHMMEANGVRLHYVIAGRGEPLVLLHGFGETWYEWHDLIPPLAAHYTVIAPDLRGAGDSERPLTGYDKKTMAEDIYQLIHQLGYTKIDLVGHDIGLMVAYAYAAAHPDGVRHLILVDAPIPGVADWDAVKEHEWHFAFQSVPDLPEALVAGKERLYLTTAFYYAKAYDPSAFTEQRIDEYVRHYAEPGAMRAAFSYFAAFPQDEQDNRVYAHTKLSMPVLAIGGEESYGPKMRETAQAVATDVTAVSLPDCGHWVAVEQPQALTQNILDFCGAGKP